MKWCKWIAAAVLVVAVVGGSGCYSTGALTEATDAFTVNVEAFRASAARAELELKAAVAEVNLSGERTRAELAARGVQSVEEIEAAVKEASEVAEARIAELREEIEVARAAEAAARAEADEAAGAAIGTLAEETANIATAVGLIQHGVMNPEGKSFLGLPVDAESLMTGLLALLLGNQYVAEKRKKARDIETAKRVANGGGEHDGA